MGLILNTALLLIDLTKESKKGKVLCLGKQEFGYKVKDIINSKNKYKHDINIDSFKNLDPNDNMNQEFFFKTLGYKTVDTLDANEYEGANIIFDLNESRVPKDLESSYDLIFDGGTLEHVFNIGIALKSLSSMLNKEGLIFHTNPCNGYIDHGFFQISPTFYFDYYLQNNFDVVSCLITENSIGIKNMNIKQDLYFSDLPKSTNYSIYKSPKGFLNFAARKKSSSSKYKTPLQGYYLSTWKGNSQKKHLVQKQIKYSNFKFVRMLFFSWTTLPYKIVSFMKKINN